MTVAVAVVSFNTRELLLRCLHSLSDDAGAGRADVWVVDNRSTDGSADAARAAAPWAHVEEPGENIGFGRAINLVARRSDAPWLLAANADAALEPGALEALVAGGRDPQVGSVVPRLVLPDGSTQHSVHPFPTVPFSLLFNLGLHRLSRPLADRLCLEGYWNPDNPRTVPWAIGACMLLRRTAFDEVGGFDAAQWMYAEDLDLSWRLHRAGWTMRYEPAARVLHESSAATRRAFGDDRESRFMAESYAMLRRRRGRMRAWATAGINVAGAAVRLAWMTPLALISARWRGRRAESRRWLRAHWAALRAPTTTAGVR
jgi:GT2 family glycosyltransferase